MGEVTVVGSYIVALVMDVDRIPIEGETVVGRNYHTTHGGKGIEHGGVPSRPRAARRRRMASPAMRPSA